MFLKERTSGKLVEVLAQRDLFNPLHSTVVGRCHYGEEAQDPESFAKSDLMFVSGEALPRCWTDAHFRDAELERAA